MNHAPATHCRLEYDDASIAWLYLDQRDSDTNTLSSDVLSDLARALDALEGREDLNGLVVLSGKTTGFVAGPSTEELTAIDDLDHVASFIDRGQSLTSRLAALPVPSVALIDGPCLSHGLELALACRYRVAQREDAMLGFPEVRLGLHPCHGGTVRLASLTGAWQALSLLRSGGSVDGDTAAKLGLVDVAASGDASQDAARDLIARDPGRRRPSAWNNFFRLRLIRRFIYKLLDYELQRKPCPAKFPATYAILRLWRDHGAGRIEPRLAAEHDSLIELVQHPGARNLVRAYLLQDRLQQASRSLDVAAPRRVHIFGAGVIGSGVAALLVLHGRRVTVHDPDEQALQGTVARTRKLLEERLAEPADVAGTLAALDTGSGDGEIDDAEFVLEAIDEDADAKRALLGRLEAGLAPDIPIGTATTTLLIEELCRGMDHPERLVGLHFLDPVERQPLVEVVAGERTGEPALAAGQALAAAAGKLALRVRSRPGFLVMRLRLPYMLEGAAMYERPKREVIDGAGLRFGMAFGPLELADAVGLDVCQRLAERLDYPVPAPLRECVAAGRLGQRTGRGFHHWMGGHHVTTGVPPGRHPFGEIAARLIRPVVKEAARCRDERIVAEADLVDVGALFGAGFPAHTGGPLTLSRQPDWEPAYTPEPSVSQQGRGRG